jgi:hypothetical protein
MEDEHAAELGPRAGSMRDGDLEEDEFGAGEEPEEHPDDGEDEDEEEGKGHQDDSGGVEDIGAVGDEEVDADVEKSSI